MIIIGVEMKFVAPEKRMFEHKLVGAVVQCSLVQTGRRERMVA
jgi:hypothetical protein